MFLRKSCPWCKSCIQIILASKPSLKTCVKKKHLTIQPSSPAIILCEHSFFSFHQFVRHQLKLPKRETNDYVLRLKSHFRWVTIFQKLFGSQRFLTLGWNQIPTSLFCCPRYEDNKFQELLKVQKQPSLPTPIDLYCLHNKYCGLFFVFTASLLGRGKVFFYKWAMFTIEITSKESIQKANLNILHWQLFFNIFNIGHLKLVVLLAHILIFKYTTST